jgi:hypothetical protein
LLAAAIGVLDFRDTGAEKNLVDMRNETPGCEQLGGF